MPAPDQSPAHAIILFDGVCNLCNRTVQFIIRRDPNGYFQFAPLQSETAHKLLVSCGVPIVDMKSVVLIEGGKAYLKSDAALGISRKLSGPWKLFAVLLNVPRFLRDPVYDFIANRRYDWFGRRAECMVPTPELKARFLD
ncbi:MAG: thiol-disulfide oxidoreductase DCC family protein [Candidatus Sumerlaeaceae bacterium]|nr:thiol-disulfide oxidoreductase DCC family protein [Candidatus Sumerlaeaceae bacterium]